MKLEQGIEINYAVQEEDPALNLIMKTLRPNMKEKTFEEFLANQTKEVMKTCKSRKRSQVSREYKSKTPNTKQFFSQRGLSQTGPPSHMAHHKHDTIDNLISALDVVNKEAAMGGIGRKSDSRSAFIQGISSIRSAATNYQTVKSRDALTETP